MYIPQEIIRRCDTPSLSKLGLQQWKHDQKKIFREYLTGLMNRNVISKMYYDVIKEIRAGHMKKFVRYLMTNMNHGDFLNL